jgi:hypothetical protein
MGARGGAAGGSSRQVRLTFEVERRINVTIEVEVIRPAGDGPFPLFLTQTNHRRWALKATARGFASCVYPGADVNDQSLAFRAAYAHSSAAGGAPPTWGTILSRSWLASRALDYLLDSTHVNYIDHARVGISGHSRNGKQAMLAGAFDERVTVVVGVRVFQLVFLSVSCIMCVLAPSGVLLFWLPRHVPLSHNVRQHVRGGPVRRPSAMVDPGCATHI